MADAGPMIDDRFLLGVLMDALHDAVYFKDRESRFLRINRVVAGWLKVADPAQAVGKSDFDYLPQAYAQATFDTEQKVLRTGEPVHLEEKIVPPDGKARWLSTTKMPLKNSAGEIIGTFGISRDIGQHKKAEERLRDSDMIYQSLVESLPQCIFRKDRDGKIVYVNRPYCAELGKTPKDLVGKTDYDLFPKAMAEKYRKDDRHVMTTERMFETVEEHKPKGKKAKKFYVRVVKTPVYDARGQVVGIQGMYWRVAHKP